ncbi:MAG: endonuclease/exonuclease/phosphatase family protein [Prevotella sp.]|nr:endonuclease/exonuclease/phosphatase family protein [Prevotella sp.]
MGKLAVHKYFLMMFLIIQIVTTIFTFVGLWGGSKSPVGNTVQAMTVYVLPLLIMANAILLVYWLIRRRWIFSAIPTLTILSCIPYIGTIYQLRSLPEDTDGRYGIKIATYNVALFGRETSGFMAQDILSEMKKQKVDVLCMQEYSDICGDKRNSKSYKEYFPYMSTGNNDMVVYSKYPIRGYKNIPFEESNNSAMWVDIDVNGKMLRVFNVHLETTGFNRTLRSAAKMEMKGLHVERNSLISAIYDNYTLGMIIRSGQAATVANERCNSPVPTIVCGDFNDVPYSYVYNTMLGDMTDGFKECGSGWMRTYKNKKPVRIDYIFHDKSLNGITYYRESLTYSDHDPVFMKIAL